MKHHWSLLQNVVLSCFLSTRLQTSCQLNKRCTEEPCIAETPIGWTMTYWMDHETTLNPIRMVCALQCLSSLKAAVVWQLAGILLHSVTIVDGTATVDINQGGLQSAEAHVLQNGFMTHQELVMHQSQLDVPTAESCCLLRSH